MRDKATFPRKPTETPERFWEWFDTIWKIRGFPNESKVAERAGVSHSVLSHARARQRPIGFEACKALAAALHVDERILLEMAGWLDPIPEHQVPEYKGNWIAQAIEDKLRELDEADLQALLNYIDHVVLPRVRKGGDEKKVPVPPYAGRRKSS